MPLLQTHNLSIGYNPTRRRSITVAEDISVSLQRGELVCLLGPNGAGKSTLMRTLAGLQSPLAGTVTLMDQDLSTCHSQDLARRLSIVLTNRIDVGALSAYDLVSLGRQPYTDWTGKLTQTDEDMVQWALEAVGAMALSSRQVNQLSDGERQKVMIARALAQATNLIVLDEPTAFLDLPNRVDIMDILRKLAHETGKSILLSTHDLDLALRSADKIWLLVAGQPLQVGVPEDLVLNGAFAAAFANEGVRFDPYTGSFRLNQTQIGVIRLVGEGLIALWTQRALERIGYTVITERSTLHPEMIEVLCPDEPNTTWQIQTSRGKQNYINIEALVANLRSKSL